MKNKNKQFKAISPIKWLGMSLILTMGLPVMAQKSVKDAKMNGQSASVKMEEAQVKQNFPLQTNSSIIYWKGEKLTGEHTGTLKLSEGRIHLVQGLPTEAVMYMDMNSIANTDIENPEYRQKLVNHLRSEDFFDVARYPVAIFRSTALEPIAGASGADPNYLVRGDLTIKGITHGISFPARILVKADRLEAMGKLSFDRSKWNVRYGSKSFFEGLGDKAIYDDIQINFNLVATPAGS